MKLFHKIFLCFIVIFGAAFQMAGYLLINFAYGNAMGQEKKLAFQEFQYNRYILQSILYSQPDFGNIILGKDLASTKPQIKASGVPRYLTISLIPVNKNMTQDK